MNMAWFYAFSSALLGQAMSCWPMVIPVFLVVVVGMFTWRWIRRLLTIRKINRPIAPIALAELLQSITAAHTDLAAERIRVAYTRYVFLLTGKVKGVKKGSTKSIIVTLALSDGLVADLVFGDDERPVDDAFEDVFVSMRPGATVMAKGILSLVKFPYIRFTECEFTNKELW